MDPSSLRPLIVPMIKGTSRHEKYINTLAKLAIAVEPVAQARLAAAIVYKNQLISFGINQRKTDPFQAKFSNNSEAIYIHAENSAIKNALRDLSIDKLSKTTLYICRVKKQDDKFVFGLAKPCLGCMKAIINFDIKKVYYTLDTGDFAEL